MKIGITFDLKQSGPLPDGAPDDLYEEFDDPSTVAAIAAALRELGHDTVELGNGRAMIEKLLADPPDLVFNFAEGQGVSRSRESRVPGVLETLGIPYTGSDPATLAACLDKDWARRLVQSAGLPVPRGMSVSFGPNRPDDLSKLGEALAESGFDLPVIAKPTCEGSSKGVQSKSIIEAVADFGPVVYEMWQAYRQPILVEEFIDGDEITVGIVGNHPPKILGVMRVMPKKPMKHFIYSIEVKRNYNEMAAYECPAKITPDDFAAVEEAALAAYEVLGCRDVARIDYRLRDGVPYFIEANPLPGLSPVTGDLVWISNFMGVSHTELIRRIVEAARERLGSQ
jgi:D-alanine-D-alanine ligase